MTLNLTLKKQWFDLIRSGEKLEEYREIKWYWVRRLLNEIHPRMEAFVSADWHDVNSLPYTFRPITHIKFTNGYSPNSPSFTIECKGIRIGRGTPEWGAPTDRDVFILSLGKIIES